MKNALLILTFFFFLSFSFSQSNFATTDTNYINLVDKAFGFLKKGECRVCIDAYEQAFEISQRSILSRLRAASCAFSCKDNAKWNRHLNFAIEKDWATAENILKDPYNQYLELTKLRDTDFYNTAFSMIKEIKLKSGYDEALAAELDIILKDDQELRQKLSNITTEEERISTWNKISELDGINLKKIEKIIEKHGYPGKSKVGAQSSTAFLVIQHSELAYQEKYFPLLEKAANEGEINKSELALLIDRIKMSKGEKQIYGSQVVDNNGKWEFSPIEDEENVNKRGADVGLGPIEEDAKYFNIEYKYIKKQD
ncbi:MAG TPA: hypothetical protein PKD85_10840 [Saprospiraceae bacterium]|nr:hypothetical protein [Saprospiraceae bacterium]